MHTRHLRPFWTALIILVLASLACGVFQAATPTALPTETPLPPTATFTATTVPTATTTPTSTPNATATAKAQKDQETIQKYVDNGYLTSTKGTFFDLSPATFSMAKQYYLTFEDTGYKKGVTDFATWADIDMESASTVNYPEYSGCGFAFRFQPNGDGYTAMLTNDSVLITWCFAGLGNMCGRIGKTRGSGRISLGNPAKVHFEFIVSNGMAYSLVDGEFVASYTLFEDKLTDPGGFLYTLISGTNKDYGTRCTINNAKLFVPAN